MNVKTLNKIVEPFSTTEPMPVLFVGHGSPMNAIESNEFTKGWEDTVKAMPKPNAILIVSAHWETDGTFITAMETPKTIHDFGGFPQALFDVQYPAPGSPELAAQVKETITSVPIGLDTHWGLDHGAWSVAMKMFPNADIPIVQLSLDYRQTPQWHYDFAKELGFLRRKGVLIIGSGNIVHNLRMVNFHNPAPYDWAIEANESVKRFITMHEHKGLINYNELGSAMKLAVPTPEHYLPLLYTLALQQDGEQASFFNDKALMGSIAMTCVRINS